MAIPDNLWKVEYTGYFTFEDNVTKRGEWASTKWLGQFAGNQNAAAALSLATFAHGIYRTTGLGERPPFCDRTRLVKTVAIHVNSGVENEFELDVALGNAFDGDPLPIQVAILAVGRTKKLGRQTRIWVPGLGQSAIGTDGRFNTDWSALFGAWLAWQLRNGWNVDGNTWVPMHWSEEFEELEFHTEDFWMREFRTIRRRCLADRETLP